LRKPPDALVGAVARRYASAGWFARMYARAKLRRDPLFAALLREGLLPDGARLLDAGCGQGMLLATLAVTREPEVVAHWPADWAKPPRGLVLRGIERDRTDAERARAALRGEAQIETADLGDAPLPRSDVIALVDVIHYLEPAAQETLLGRVRDALAPGGLLLLRICDADAGLRAALTRAGDHLGVLPRRGRVGRLHLRSAAAWTALLRAAGLAVAAAPMAEGTPFANVLLVARANPAGPGAP
jgi:SAM-dependent methyltransferase